MALQCGTTNNGCNGQSGLIRVEYTIPDPPYVRYQYPNSDWKRVSSGVRYTTEQQNQIFTGGQCPTTYRLSVQIAIYRNQQFQGWSEVVDYVYKRGPFSKMTLVLNNVELNKLEDHFYVMGGARVYFFKIDNESFQVGGVSDGIRIADLQRLDGLPDNCGNPPGGNCTFKVFDLNNQVLYQETRDVCPTAEKMPSVYGDNKGSFNAKSVDAQPLKVAETEANNIKSTLVELGTTTIKKIDSPSGSTLFPKVCWDCDEDKCPDGTCEVDCGAHICCYDKNGIAVKTILK